MARSLSSFLRIAVLATIALTAACHGAAPGSLEGFIPDRNTAAGSTFPHHLHAIAFAKAHKPIATSAGQDVYALFKLEEPSLTAWIYGAPAVTGNAAPLAQIGVKSSKLETYVYVDARGRVYELKDQKTSALILVSYKNAKGSAEDVYGDMCLKNQIVGTFSEMTSKSGVTAVSVKPSHGKCPTALQGAVAFGTPADSENVKSAPSKQNLAYYSCAMSATLFRSAADKFYLMSGLSGGSLAKELHETGDLDAAQAQFFAGLCNDPNQIALGTEAAPKCPPDCIYSAPPVPLVAAPAFCPVTKVVDITFNAPAQNCTATLTGKAGAAFTVKDPNTSIVTVNPASGTFPANGKVTLTFVAGLAGGSTLVSATTGTSQVTYDVTNAWTTSAPTAIAALAIALQEATLPIGQTMSVNVTAKSADGQTIQGSYDHPIALTAKNLTLSSATVSTSAEAAALTVSWKSGFTGSGTGSITASADGQTATVTVQPGSGFVYYSVGSNPNADATGFQMTLGPDGNIYYGTQGPSTCSGGFCSSNDGAIGQFNPNSGAFTEIELGSSTAGVFFSSDGALWVGGNTSHNLFRFAPGQFAMAAMTTIAVPAPTGGSKYMIRNMTQDGSGNLWFTDGRGGRVIKLPLSGPFTPSSLTPYALPTPPVISNVPQNPPWLGGIAFNAASSAGPNVLPGLFTTDYFNGIVWDVDPSTGMWQTILAGTQQNAAGSAYTVQPRFIVLYNTSQLAYTGLGAQSLSTSSATGPPNGFVDHIDATTNPVHQPAFGIPAAPSGREPDSIAANGSYIYYADLSGGLGFIDANTSAAREFPIVPVSAGTSGFSRAPDGVVVMPDGTAWFTCYGNATAYLGPLCLGHTVYTSGWSLWPGPAFTIAGYGATHSQPVGVMESPSQNSGPFTASVDNSAVCSVTLATNAYSSGSSPDHNFTVTGLTAGTCTVTIYDSGRKHSNQLKVTVVASEAAVRRAATRRF
ncbi:MAG: hypothetical protein JO029_06345 [Candidatus Eremiobacteraeota bacterium]|nr:hypothetical protein [Candidatus Eremiobacteraeota bacterium]